MGQPKITGPDTLERWPRENPMQHRALLLFAMQKDHNPNGMLGRSMRAAAIAIQRSYTVVRSYADKRRWAERILHHGEEAEQYAITLYRAMYMHTYGAAELPHVQHLTAVNVGPLDSTTTEVQEEARRILRRIVPPPEADPVEAEKMQKKVENELDKAKKERIKQNRIIRSVSYKSIQYFNSQLDAGRVRVSLSDLVVLRKVIADLDEELRSINSGDAAPSGALALADTVRVQLAKETGADVMEAHYEDALEAVMILESIRKNTKEEPGVSLVEEPREEQEEGQDEEQQSG